MSNLANAIKDGVTMGYVLIDVDTNNGLSDEVISSLRYMQKALNKIDDEKGKYKKFSSSAKVLPDALGRLQYLLKNIYQCDRMLVRDFFYHYAGILKALNVYSTETIQEDLKWKPLPITKMLYKVVSPYPCLVHLSKCHTASIKQRYSDIICDYSKGVTTRPSSDMFTYIYEFDVGIIESTTSAMIHYIMKKEHSLKK